MNAHTFRTTTAIRALMAAGAALHTREDPLEALTRSITEHNQAILDRLQQIDQRHTDLSQRFDQQSGRPIPAAARRQQVQEQRFDRNGRLNGFNDPGRQNNREEREDRGGRESTFDNDAAQVEREAIGNFVRSGGVNVEELQHELADLATRAGGMSVSSDPDGGYLVTPVLSTSIQRRQADVSPIARLARRVTITTGDAFEEPVDPSDIGAEWVDENEERPELDTAKMRMLHVPLNEIYTLQPVTQRLIDDSSYNLGAYIESKISDKFAVKGGNAYINGDGIKKPEGLLHRPTNDLPDGERDYFTIQHKVFAAGSDAAVQGLIDMVYLLRSPYRKNARWLMNSKTAGFVRKLTDVEGRYVWADNLAAGQPPLLLGYPVELDEEMPDMESGNLPIAFGDFSQAYIIVDRPGIRILLDPYTKKPLVLFYAYARMGGQVQNGEAVKVWKYTTG